jgi:hypothetical protein
MKYAVVYYEPVKRTGELTKKSNEFTCEEKGTCFER